MSLRDQVININKIKALVMALRWPCDDNNNIWPWSGRDLGGCSKPIHTERKQKFSLMFIVYSLNFYVCPLIFFAFSRCE